MSNIEEKIAGNAALTESALDSLLPRTDGSGASGVPHSVIYEAMRYAAMSGGKRIRPFLTIEFCRMTQGDITTALPYACAIECVHTYSLIHDDLPCMDDDDERRGKPSCHRAYGEANALLAGDALLTYAFSLCAENPFTDAERNMRAVSVLSGSAGYDGMIGGQICDLLYDKLDVSFEELAEMQRKKTGELIAASCLLGCIASGCDDEALLADVRKYAYNIGLSFQIRDDILDAGDMLNGETDGDSDKTTILSFMSRNDAEALSAALTKEAVSAISGYPNSETLVDFAVWLYNRQF